MQAKVPGLHLEVILHCCLANPRLIHDDHVTHSPAHCKGNMLSGFALPTAKAKSSIAMNPKQPCLFMQEVLGQIAAVKYIKNLMRDGEEILSFLLHTSEGQSNQQVMSARK